MASRATSRRQSMGDIPTVETLSRLVRRASSILPPLNTIFPSIFIEIVERLAIESDCSAWMVVPPIISICGLMMGSRAHIFIDRNNWNLPPIFWCVVLAFSGMGKSPAHTRILACLDNAEKEIRNMVIHPIAEPNATPECEENKKKLKFHLTGKTFEKMFDSLLESANPELTAFELGTIFDKMDIYHKSSGGSGGLDRTSLLSLKNGGRWEMQTLGHPERELERTHVVLAGYTQPERFLSLHSNNGDDLMNRFNVFIPEPRMSMYQDTDGPRAPPPSVRSTDYLQIVEEVDSCRIVPSKSSRKLVELFRRIWLLHHDKANGGSTIISHYWLNGEAKKLFVSEYNYFQQISNDMTGTSGYGSGGIFSKLRQEVAVVAAIIHVITNFLHRMEDGLPEEEDGLSSNIDLEAMQTASKLIRASLEQRLVLIDDKTLLNVYRNAEGEPVLQQNLENVGDDQNGPQEEQLFNGFEKKISERLLAMAIKLIRDTSTEIKISKVSVVSAKNYGTSREVDTIFAKFEYLGLGTYDKDHVSIRMAEKFRVQMKCRGPVFIKKFPDRDEVAHFINILGKHFNLTLSSWMKGQDTLLFPSKSQPIYNGVGQQECSSGGHLRAVEHERTCTQHSDSNVRGFRSVQNHQNEIGGTRNEGTSALDGHAAIGEDLGVCHDDKGKTSSAQNARDLSFGNDKVVSKQETDIGSSRKGLPRLQEGDDARETACPSDAGRPDDHITAHTECAGKEGVTRDDLLTGERHHKRSPLNASASCAQSQSSKGTPQGKKHTLSVESPLRKKGKNTVEMEKSYGSPPSTKQLTPQQSGSARKRKTPCAGRSADGKRKTPSSIGGKTRDDEVVNLADSDQLDIEQTQSSINKPPKAPKKIRRKLVGTQVPRTQSKK